MCLGDIKLNNLRLKKSALDRFDLPVDVKEGKLHLSERAMSSSNTNIRFSWSSGVGYSMVKSKE
jgi:hypothetical protein